MCSKIKPVVTELEHLEHEIVELAAQIHAATCRWLELVAEFDRREGWSSWGCKSCAHWVAWRCAISPVAAREHVRVARALTELPLIRASFTRGELSYSKVRALTRVAGIQREEELVSMARHATAAQLERILGAYRRAVRVQRSAAELGRPERWVRWGHDEDGSLVLTARLPAEEGAVVLAALDAARDASAEAFGEAAVADDVPSWAERCADALVATAESALRGEPTARSGDRYQVVVHVDAHVLAGASAEAAVAELENGTPLAVATARRLACDNALVGLVEREGETLSVGRKTRAVPPALRRALRNRDRGCRFPGCTTTRHVDAHHIEHWADGGETAVGNLVELCRHHHRLVHEGGYSVRRAGSGFRFRRPDGRLIPRLPAPASPDEEPVGRLRAACVAHNACVPLGGGQRYDLGMAVDAVLAYAPPPMALGV
jgi:hypothetical protein